jgi:5-hydroxyisourate hydrolase-like protein (transthyretin family)
MKQLTTLLVFGSIAALAHDMYLMPRRFYVQPGENILVSVHNGDSFPQGEHGVDPSRMPNFTVVGGEPLKDVRILGNATHGFAAIPGQGTKWVKNHSLPRLLELAAPRWEKYLMQEGLNHVVAERAKMGETNVMGRELYSKFTKAMVVSGESDGQYTANLGYPVEFILEADPARMSAGDSLPVQLLWNGKPAGDVQVELAWAPNHKGPENRIFIAGRTDAQGRIRVALEKSGLYRLHAVVMERCKDKSKADWESYWASLTFELRGASTTRTSN